MPTMQDASNLIPDASVTPLDNSSNGSDSNGIADVLMLVAIIMLASSLAISVGVFLYAKLTDKKLDNQKNSLEKVKNSFDDTTISKLKLLSRRLTVGKDVLSKHIAPSEIFRALENITLKSVQFKEFKFDGSAPETLRVSLKGTALSVNAVAAQSKAFAANNDKFQNIIFSDLGFEKDGTISFRVTADVNPEFINFQNLALKKIKEGSGQSYGNSSDTQNIFTPTGSLNTNTLNSGRAELNTEVQNNSMNSSGQEQGQIQQTDEFGNLINN